MTLVGLLMGVTATLAPPDCDEPASRWRGEEIVEEQCRLTEGDEASAAIDAAVAWFKQQVVSEITSMRVRRVQVCETKLVVSIEARTSNYNFPRIWMVYVNRSDPAEKYLLRPE